MSVSSSTPLDLLGHVVSISGSQASVRLSASDPASKTRTTVGTFLALEAAQSSVVGVITDVVSSGDRTANGESSSQTTARVDLLGEIRKTAVGSGFFQRGITGYPMVGDKVTVLGDAALRIVYDTSAHPGTPLRPHRAVRLQPLLGQRALPGMAGRTHRPSGGRAGQAAVLRPLSQRRRAARSGGSAESRVLRGARRRTHLRQSRIASG